MEYIVNSKEMKQLDKNTIEYYGVPSPVLMERAALAVFQEIEKRFDNTYSILILAGAGNNGGDGLAIARLLYLSGYPVHIFMPMPPDKMTEETKCQYHIVEKYKIPVAEKLQGEYDVIVDALFGIGLSRPIEGRLKEAVTWCNERQAFKIAVDMPSGVSADTGEVLGEAFLSDITVTFGFPKVGQILFPGAGICGELIVADIGIDNKSILDKKPEICRIQDKDIASLFPRRKKDSNKGTYGKVLVIAGSDKMAGAAYFSSKAAYLMGCGLVQIFTPKENRDILLARLPEAILTEYDSHAPDISLLLEKIKWADVIVAGPGMGMGEGARIIIEEVLEKTQKPVVLDADGLNLAANHLSWLKHTKASVIITPHLGEMSRLMGREISDIKKSLVNCAKEFSKEYHLVCVLKDSRTVIASKEGICINTTGCNGMAAGGSGDVLAGMIAGMSAQIKSLEEAAVFGTYLHGRAGEQAAKLKGNASMLATDMLEQIPNVIKTLPQEGSDIIEK